MERSQAGTKGRSLDCLALPNQNTIQINNMVLFSKYKEIQLTKNKMDLNNRKMTNHPPSPVISDKIKYIFFFIKLFL